MTADSTRSFGTQYKADLRVAFLFVVANTSYMLIKVYLLGVLFPPGAFASNSDCVSFEIHEAPWTLSVLIFRSMR